MIDSLVRLKNIVPLAHLSDPATSKRAARLVAEYSDSQATACLYALLAAEPYGMTYYDLETSLTMCSAKQRLSDLKRAGLVYGTGETRTAFGSDAEVYRPVNNVVRAVTGAVQGRLL